MNNSLKQCITKMHRLFLLSAPLIFSLSQWQCQRTIPAEQRAEGQSDFISTSPLSRGGNNTEVAGKSADASTPNANNAPAENNQSAPNAGGNPLSQPEETDIYRVEGNTLYVLNAYRGLLIFDITNIDTPVLMSRSEFFGWPVEMSIKNGIASVILSDWYSVLEDNQPFHGSLVRNIDVKDLKHPRVLSEVKIGGFAQDARVVGNTLHIISQDYGFDSDLAQTSSLLPDTSPNYNPRVIITSIKINDDGTLVGIGQLVNSGYGSVMHVTASAILLAVKSNSFDYRDNNASTDILYIDIRNNLSLPEVTGKIHIDGSINSWSADNGRFNLDFSNAPYAYAVGCDRAYCYNGQGNYTLFAIDFTQPKTPVLISKTALSVSSGWNLSTRFLKDKLYLIQQNNQYYEYPNSTLNIYDLKDPKNPKKDSSMTLDGVTTMIYPLQDKLFTLGYQYNTSNARSLLSYLDIQDSKNPKLLGKVSFGGQWGWTPASYTFKAFSYDPAHQIVALPFSGYTASENSYHRGVQFFSTDSNTLSLRKVVLSTGYVERAVFAKDRVLAISDLSLGVIRYIGLDNPELVQEQTLAHNIVRTLVMDDQLLSLASDWFGYDESSVSLILSKRQTDEIKNYPPLSTLKIEGNNAQLFQNGTLVYVVSQVQTIENDAVVSYPKVTVVDVQNGQLLERSQIRLPSILGRYSPFIGCYSHDWFYGFDAVLVGNQKIAIRQNSYAYVDYLAKDNDAQTKENSDLLVVDVSDKNAPFYSSLSIHTHGKNDWWGQMLSLNDKLYLTHYEWMSDEQNHSRGRYFMKEIDLSDMHQIRISKAINTPGILIGKDNKTGIFYTMDYRYDYNTQKEVNQLAAVEIIKNKAYLRGVVDIQGAVGRSVVVGNKIYTSAYQYSASKVVNVKNGDAVAANNTLLPPSQKDDSGGRLYQINMANPKKPVVNSSLLSKRYGWLVDVVGDRAIMMNYSNNSLDIYKLSDMQSPVFDKFARIHGFSISTLSLFEKTLYLASGYYGIQEIEL